MLLFIMMGVVRVPLFKGFRLFVSGIQGDFAWIAVPLNTFFADLFEIPGMYALSYGRTGGRIRTSDLQNKIFHILLQCRHRCR